MESFTISVDPGVNGAIAVLDPWGKCQVVYDMPTYFTGTKKQREVDGVELKRMLTKYNTDEIVLEKVHSMPQQGVASTFNFGINYGIVKGVIHAIGRDIILVTPQAWKKHFSLLKTEKDEARLLAIKLFPDAPLSRKKDVDRADALLMASWRRETK